LSNNRAVAEVIGALLMIALAVTGGVIVYVYSAGLIGTLHGGKVNQSYLEQVSLEYYAWTNNKLNLTLRNVGRANIQFQDYFIAGRLVTPNGTCGSSLATVTLKVGQSCTEILPTPSTASVGISYTVRVVTIDGAIFDFVCIAGTRN